MNDLKEQNSKTVSYKKLISQASDRYGSKLIELMNYYNVHNLQMVSEEQAKEYYEKFKMNKGE